MRSANKAVLFIRTAIGKVHAIYPVAAFNTERSAKAFGRELAAAFKSGDPERVKVLYPEVHLTEEGKLPDTFKLSVKVLPYEPSPTGGDDEMFEDAN